MSRHALAAQDSPRASAEGCALWTAKGPGGPPLLAGLLGHLVGHNSSRTRLRAEMEAFARTLPTGALVLDAGAGDAPYRSLLAHTRYESADFQQVDKHYEPATYACDLSAIPVADERYDAVVLSQVMEHLPEPATVLAELVRVLRPGGRMIYTGPLYFEEHEVPYDFYRYTQFGLRHLFSGAGLRIDRLDWLEGYFGTVGYQLNRMARYLPSSPGRLGGGRAGLALTPLMVTLRVVAGLASIGFHRLELRVKYVERGHPKNYVAILTKPLPPRAAPTGLGAAGF